MAAITETAYAKINLYLSVTAIREDGYHELDSLFAFAEFGDALSFSLSDDLSLRVDGPFGADIPDTNDNLVLRAAHALREATGCPAGAEISLVKNLRVASGIGGGSADAAAALRGLNRLWELNLNEVELAQLGATLGADVPACVGSQPVHVTGIGDVFEPCAMPDGLWLVLVSPGEPVSTPVVFDLYDQSAQPQSVSLPAPANNRHHWIEDMNARSNDLEPAARSLVPAISDVISRISEEPGCWVARMSGSGATCFGLFDDEIAANAAAEAITADHPWWAVATRLRQAQ